MRPNTLALIVSFVILLSSADLVAAQEQTQELVPLPIELPEPCFGGRPFDGGHPNLEPEDFGDRPPFLAPKGTVVISRNKPISSSAPPINNGELSKINDGNKECDLESLVVLPDGKQWVQIDLCETYEIFAILIWHRHDEKTVCFDVKVQLSNDSTFKNQPATVFNNSYDFDKVENGPDKYYFDGYQGRLIDAMGSPGQYVRCYSNGSFWYENNPYIEVEVWGRPVRATE